jgi:hypothetical protein
MRQQAGKLLQEMWRIKTVAGPRASLRYARAIAQHGGEILRTGRLLTADAEMQGRVYNMRLLGTTIRVPGACFGLARELYGRMCYFAVEGFKMQRDEVVVDLGANCGLLSVLAGRLGARAVAVEAQAGLY